MFKLAIVVSVLLSHQCYASSGASAGTWDELISLLLQLVIAVVLTVLTRRGLISHEVKTAIEAAAQRARDKYLRVATVNTVDGGDAPVVTAESVSAARAEALTDLLKSLTPAARKFVDERGPDWAKGLIGTLLDDKLTQAGITRIETK